MTSLTPNVSPFVFGCWSVLSGETQTLNERGDYDNIRLSNV